MRRLETIGDEISSYEGACRICTFPGNEIYVVGEYTVYWKNSGIWKKFSDKLLEYQEDMNAGVADIRYKEIREYLMEQYVDLVKTMI